MPITEKIKSHLKLKSKKATSPYPNISRILTKINAITRQNQWLRSILMIPV